MSDTGESVLSESERKSLMKAARGIQDGQHLIILKSNGDSSFSKLKDALLLASILGLVATVWNMSINVARLETMVTNLVAQVADLKTRIKP